MRFLMMTTETGQNPDESLYVEMGKFIEEMTASGVLIATGGLDPKATHVRSAGGKLTVTDGPFSEAKEAVVGFALVEVEDLEQALHVSERFWAIIGDGAGIIQQVF